ncbi:Phage integrase family protein [Duganella sacchari]|uniref:Phage integrase family protein n=1 Tax=Duganella sacchari TaxID=551987 RepID=A0A1M7R517_9BURK|nr:gamma-mobile-trio recombinase GmtY [Duganella sacchari]SHN40524.1 Phage integrase family protein [Duganella sacchari]
MSTATTAIVKDGRRSKRPTCILITDHGIYWPLAEYFLRRNLSLSTERAYALSIRRLMNWTEAKHSAFVAGGGQDSSIFASFLHDLTYGTIHNSEDPSGLWWLSHSPEVVKRTAGHIAEFSDWLASTGEGISINPRDRPASAFEQMVTAKAFAHKKAASLLAHAKHQDASRLFSSMTRQVTPPGRIQKLLSTPPAFPESKINELLWVGFQNEKYKADPRPWKRWKLRDILITLICLYGGARVSEPMHLWLEDARRDESDPDSCRILIHEPDHGKVTIDDPVLGKKNISRTDYLTLYCNGKTPLTRAMGCRHSGWKGGLLDVPDRLAMDIKWINPEAGRLFKQLWEMYVQNVRPMSPTLPWAFLTKNGLPMGTSAYSDSLEKAVRKIGLKFKKSHGSTPHGLRHRYGQWLNDLGVNEKVGQVCMHHANPLSQEVYRQLSAEQVAQEMKAAALHSRISVPALPLEVL